MATGRLPDPNTAPVTAKGDLYTYSTVPAKLAVGSNGETLVADSSASTGLRWQGNYAAGKNKIINADFNINQRAFSSTTGNLTYMFDRYVSGISLSAGTATFSAQTFTPGTAPVAGYEGVNFLQCLTSGTSASNTSTQVHFNQRIEDVRTFAGQTVTFSFWAKAASGTPNIGVRLERNYGSGGSASDFSLFDTVKTITTSWARYTFTASIASVSGKTIGASSYLAFRVYVGAGSAVADVSGVGLQDNTFQFWGLQAETGNTATAFQTATGTLAGELSACLRYFQVLGGTSGNEGLAVGFNYSTTAAACVLPFRQQMRSAPTISFGTGAAASDFALYNASGTPLTVTSFTIVDAALGSSRILASVASGLVQGNGTNLITNSTTGKLFVSAEL